MSSGRAVTAAALLLLLWFATESGRGARLDAPTSDEPVNLASGYAWLKTGRVLLNPEHPPLGKALVAAPLLLVKPGLETDTDAWRHGGQWLAAYEFLWENRLPAQRILVAARLGVVLQATLVVGLIFVGARRVYGPAAGLLSLLAAVACPDLLGHGHLATLDLPVTLAAVLSLAALIGWAERPRRGRLLLLSLAQLLLLGSKSGSVQLLPALGAAAVVRGALDPELCGRFPGRLPAGLGRWPRLAGAYLMLGGLFLATAYGGGLLALGYLRSPGALLAGLEWNARLAGYGHPTYLLGQTSWDGFRHYFLVALGVKLPVLTLLLLAAALASLPWLRARRGKDEATLGVFALVVLALSSLSPAQTGVRYLLPIYPVLLGFSGRILLVPMPRRGLQAGVAAAMIGGFGGVVAAARPTYLSYFNELVGGPERAIGVLADSNLDWGQDLGRVGEWLAARGNPPVRLAMFSNAPPEAFGIRWQAMPAAGPVLAPPRLLLGAETPDLVMVSANNLLGLFLSRDLYAWLRVRQPVAVVGGSVWVFDLGREPAAHRRLALTYEQVGWKRWAAHEESLADELAQGR